MVLTYLQSCWNINEILEVSLAKESDRTLSHSVVALIFSTAGKQIFCDLVGILIFQVLGVNCFFIISIKNKFL